MGRGLLGLAFVSLISVGAIFGFFYAWVCSTMWGLDATDPRVAITAMQAMNASVRNGVFFPAFFLTPVFLGVTALVAVSQRHKGAAALFGSAAVIYFLGAFLVTASVNVPMNEALGAITVPTDQAAAQEIWTAYSSQWQVWNLIRTLVSGLSLVLTGLGIFALGRHSA